MIGKLKKESAAYTHTVVEKGGKKREGKCLCGGHHITSLFCVKEKEKETNIHLHCLLRRFQLSTTASYGNCYTFNAKINEGDLERTLSQTGPLLGLALVIGLEQNNYMNGGQSKQAGARLIIHQNSQGNHTYSTVF